MKQRRKVAMLRYDSNAPSVVGISNLDRASVLSNVSGSPSASTLKLNSEMDGYPQKHFVGQTASLMS
jgi:hypothetical protein